MQGFIFGRSTVQIMMVIQATLNFIALLIGFFNPVVLLGALIVLNGVGGLLAVYVGVLANSGTTPTFDPILPSGTVVKVTNGGGNVIASTTLGATKTTTKVTVAPDQSGDGVA